MIEFVERGERGRHFTAQRKVRLSDTGPDGVLRPDGLVRYLQDVAGDDWDDTGVDADDTWVVRRTAIRLGEGGAWPLIGDQVSLTTWCGGSGAAWAERRTNLSVGPRLMVEAVALWVPIDPTGHPRRLRQSFFDIYGEAAGARRVSGRITLHAPPADAAARAWPLRRADLDVVGHVNNAALWTALSEIVDSSLAWAVMNHHGAVEGGEHVQLVTGETRLWLSVEGVVRVSGEYGTR